jgi:hypothetical protein
MEALRRATRTVPFARTSPLVCGKMSNLMQAIFECRTLAGQEPGNIEAHLAVARASLKAGDRERALRKYDRVLALASGETEAREFVVTLKARS